MWRLVGLIGAVVVMGCRSSPSWLKEAPLIGIRVKDDLGREIYLSQAPRRVAIAVPEALPLWEKSGLLDRVVAACYGSGENPRIYYLLCDDSLSLGEALYRAQVEWVWISRPTQVAAYSKAKTYVYQPTSPEAWLRHLRLLGEVYDNRLVMEVADSLAKVLQTYDQQLKEARRFRVMVLSEREGGEIYTRSHPLSSLIERAGGSMPYTDSAGRAVAAIPPESIAKALPEIILVPEGAAARVDDLLRICPDLYSSPAIQYKRIFSVPRELLQQPYANPLQTLYTFLRVLHPEIAGAPIGSE